MKQVGQFEELHAFANYRSLAVVGALRQPSVVSAITKHAYVLQEQDDWNYEYVNAAKSLECAVTRNLCRVARYTANSPQTTNTVGEMVLKYHQEVLGKLTERSIESSKCLYFLDQTKDQRNKELTPAQRKRLKAVGQKVEFDPKDVEDLWKKNLNSEDVKRWTETAKHDAIRTYSKIMQPIMEGIGRTAYKTKDSVQVIRTMNNLLLPEVITFLGTCDHSIMPELFPKLIVAAARDNNTQYLKEEVPKIEGKIQERWKKAEEEAFGKH